MNERKAEHVLQRDSAPIVSVQRIGDNEVLSFDYDEDVPSSRLRLWSVSEGRCLHETELRWRPADHEVCLTTGLWVGAWDDEVVVWDAGEARRSDALSLPEEDAGRIRGAIAADATHAAIWTKEWVFLLDAESMQWTAQLEARVERKLHRWPKNGLLVSSDQGTALWDWRADDIFRTSPPFDSFYGLQSVRPWDDDTLLAITSPPGLWVWQPRAGRTEFAYREKYRKFDDMLPMGEMLVTCGDDRVEDEKSGKWVARQLRLWRTDPWEAEGYIDQSHGAVDDGEVDPTGGVGPRLARLSDDEFVVWNEDGVPAISKWSWPDRERLSVVNLPEPPSSADKTEIVVLAQPQLAVSTNGSSNIDVWDLEAMEHRVRLVGHVGPVGGLLELDGDRLVSWSMDGSIRIWEDGAISNKNDG